MNESNTMTALSNHDMPRFYAEMICTYMEKLPDGAADQMVDVQMALGLSDSEFESGLKWCVERGIITLSGFDTHKH
jgi:hypothetical protein